MEGDYYGSLLTYYNLHIAVSKFSHKTLTGFFSAGLTWTRVFHPYSQETTQFSLHLDKKSRDVKIRKPTIKSNSFTSKPDNF